MRGVVGDTEKIDVFGDGLDAGDYQFIILYPDNENVLKAKNNKKINLIIRISAIVITVIFARMANYELKKRIDRLVLEMPSSVTERDAFIRTQGGTSRIAAVIAVMIMSAVISAIMMLLTPPIYY